MLHIKTIQHGPGVFPRCGVLWKPILEGKVCNDDQLYAAVRRAGLATIIAFKEDNPLELEEPQVLTAEDFCSTWRGD